MRSSASRVEESAGAKPPSSPTAVERLRSASSRFSAMKISEPQRTASAIEPAPTGMIMNSCTSMGLSACWPPLTMFIMGTGSTRAVAPPT